MFEALCAIKERKYLIAALNLCSYGAKYNRYISGKMEIMGLKTDVC